MNDATQLSLMAASALGSAGLVYYIRSSPSKGSSAADIARAYPKAKHFAKDIVRVANNLGIPDPGWLANLIRFESAGTFDPYIRNSLGYTGLIQFGTSASKDLAKIHKMDVTTNYLRGLSAPEQMKWVEKYFNIPWKRNNSKYQNPAEMYMAVCYPASMNSTTGELKPGYRFPAHVIAANNGIDTPWEYTRRANQGAKLPTGMDGREFIGIQVNKPKRARNIALGFSAASLGLLSLYLFYGYMTEEI